MGNKPNKKASGSEADKHPDNAVGGRDATQTICWSQTILVVGQEEAGKSALCRALNGYQCADHAQMTEASTVGIDIVKWPTVVAIPRTNRSTHSQSHIHCTASVCPYLFGLPCTLDSHCAR